MEQQQIIAAAKDSFKTGKELFDELEENEWTCESEGGPLTNSLAYQALKALYGSDKPIDWENAK